MESNSHVEDAPDLQADINRVALSLDSLLVNGIQFGVIRPMGTDFLTKAGDSVLDDLDALESDISQVAGQACQKGKGIVGRAKMVAIDLNASLRQLVMFRSLTLNEMHGILARLIGYRADFIGLVEELETCLPTPKPFYSARPKEAVAAIDGFIADLPRLFEGEWKSARSETDAATA